MTALEAFEAIASLRRSVERVEEAIAEAHAAAGPKGQSMGTIGGGGHSDAMAGIDSLLDSDAYGELERMRGELIARTDRATDVLYGRSGRGGLARHDLVGADVLCCHYLMGIAYTEIGRMLDPDMPAPYHWCRDRARRACRAIDRIGADALADS